MRVWRCIMRGMARGEFPWQGGRLIGWKWRLVVELYLNKWERMAQPTGGRREVGRYRQALKSCSKGIQKGRGTVKNKMM